MKTQLNKLLTFLTICFVLAGTIVACKKSAINGVQAQKNNYSARDVARGLLFLDGPVMSAVPQLRDAREFLNSTLKNKIGVTDYVRAKEREDVAIDEILNTINKLDPSFLENFKQKATSKNPQIITEALKSANNMVYTAVLYKQYGSKVKVEENKVKLNKIFFGNGNQVSQLVAEVNSKKLNGEAIGRKVGSMMNLDSESQTKKRAFEKDGAAFTNQLAEADEGDCILAIALNVGAFVNIGMIVNVVALVNVEVGFNVHQAAAVTKYTAITKEFQNEASKVSGLNGEMLSASIAQSL